MLSIQKLFKQIILFFSLVGLLTPSDIFSFAGPGGQSSAARGGLKNRSTILNINNISMWASDNGLMEQNTNTLRAGVSFPRGKAAVVNKGGLVWGGKVNDGNPQVIRVGGQTTRSGTVPGRIIAPGIVENGSNADVRIYRIRRDWETADLIQDAMEFFNLPSIDVTEREVGLLRETYQNDWIEWPWQKGAPYYERNGIPGYQSDPDGVYDSTQDEPGLGGADQVIWYVSNDLQSSATGALYGSVPIGLEMQVTCWGYKNDERLSNVIFQRYRLLYKGTATTPSWASIDSLYIAKWVDPDIGLYSDDFVGSDPGRDLGFCYNARTEDQEYVQYHMPPPVVGYALLQGPRSPNVGAKAKWNLMDIVGYENLPMTTFTYFAGTDRSSDYNLNSYSGSLEWWNLFRGYKHTPISPPTCLFNPVAMECTKYELDGDPELFHGWIDGIPDSAGDRRFALISGPSSLAYGDSQEVVIALTAGTGANHRTGVSVISDYVDAAHDAYYLNFRFPAPIPNAKVRVAELENKIILDFESDTTHRKLVESYYSEGYRFESYTIYQYPLPDAPRDQAIVYQFFDPTQPRMLYITEDKLRNQPLVNGQKYYFAVTTSVYNPDPAVNRTRRESPAVILEIVPHYPNPGTVIPYSIGDTLSDAKNFSGENDGIVRVIYFDPSRSDGHRYELLYHRDKDPWIDFDEKPKWSLIDQTMNDTILSRLPTDLSPERVITRGFSIETFMPLHRIKGIYQIHDSNGPMKVPVFDVPNPGNEFMIVGPGSSTLDTLKGQHQSDNDVELRFTGDSSWTFFRTEDPKKSPWVRVPYTAWQRRLVGNDTIYRRLYTTHINEAYDSVWRPADLLRRTYDGKPLNVFPAIVILIDSVRVGDVYYGGQYHDDLPYRADVIKYRDFLWFHGNYYSTKVSVTRAYIADLDNDGEAAPRGTVIRFERFKEIRDGDKKYFISRPVVTSDYEAAQQAVKMINVFPNPYYGMNRAEINRFDRFVTFSHLPHYAAIRIFNLAGILVKTIMKENSTQFATWDLKNENGLAVAGGLYIVHMSLEDENRRDLGEKILKLMIVPEDQTPETD